MFFDPRNDIERNKMKKSTGASHIIRIKYIKFVRDSECLLVCFW